jgi:aminobenzoyl-glutamate utilization protein A
MHDCTMDIKLMGAAESMVSDTDLSERIADVCKNKLRLKVSETLKIKLGGSEDFSYMANCVQAHGGKASFMRVRCPIAGVGHGRTYNFDESYLPKAVKVFCGMAYDLMK